MQNLNLLLASEDVNNKEIALLSILGEQCSGEAISFFIDECLDREFFSCEVVGNDFVIKKEEYNSDDYYFFEMEIIIPISQINDDFLFISGNGNWEKKDMIPYFFKSSAKETKHGEDKWDELEWDNRRV